MRFFVLFCCITSVIVLSFSSCTIEKRLYRPGFHVDWKKSSSGNQNLSKIKSTEREIESPNQVNKTDIEHKLQRDFIIDDQILAQADVNDDPQNGNVNKDYLDEYQQPDCETLVLNDMTKLEVNLIEIGIHELKYKDCGRSVGKTFTISKSEVARIIYADGSEEQVYYDEALEREKERNRSKSAHYRGIDENQTVRSPEIVGIFSLIFGLFANFSAAIALYATSIALVFTVMALVYGIFALTTGIVSLSKIASSPDAYSGRGAAILGLILGILNIVFAILVFTAVIILLSL